MIAENYTTETDKWQADKTVEHIVPSAECSLPVPETGKDDPVPDKSET